MLHVNLAGCGAVTDATKILFQNPLNPWSHTEIGKSIAAGCELFERTTRRYGKPEWGLDFTEVNAIDVESMGLYWHFVDIVWIVIFTAVYLLEYL